MALEALGFKREVVDGSPVAKPGPTGYKKPEQKTTRPQTKQKAAQPSKPKVDPEKAKRECSAATISKIYFRYKT